MGEVFRVEIPINVRDNTDPGISQATRKVSAFDRASQKTQERLEKMNRSRYQVILEALDRASSIIGHVSTKARSIAGRTYSFTMKVVDMATAPLKSIWNFATSLQGVILGGGLTAVGFKGLQLSGEMDRAKKSIDFFTGSAEEGTKAFQELVNQAIKSPLYEVPFVVQTAGQLLAAGKNIEFVKRALKDFEQTAYYTGASLSQIELAFYGFKQISSVGTLQMEELRQVTENLNLPLQWVIEELGLTGKAAKNLGDAAIPANEAMEAILKTMEKRFPAKDMQDDLLALESALKETGRMFLWAFGRGMSGPVMRIMQDLSAQLDPTGKKFNSFAGSLEYAGKVVGEKLEQIYKDVKEFLDKFNQGELKNMGLGDKLIYGIEYGLDEASKWLQGAGGKKVEKVFVEMAEIAGRAWMTALGASLKGAGNAVKEGNWGGAAALGGMAWMLGAGTLLGMGGRAAIAGGKGLWKAGKWLFGKGSKAADAAADAAKVAGAAAGAADDAADIMKTTKNLKDAAESFRAAANASKEAEKAVKTAEALKAAKQADLEKNARLLKELKREAAKFGDDIPKGLSGKIMAAEKAVAKGRVDVKKAASHLDDMINLKNLKAIDYANAREGFVIAKDVANAAKVADQVGGAASKTGIFSKIVGLLGKNGDDVLKAGSKAAGKGIKGIPVLGTLFGLATSGAVVASAAPENRGREAAGEVGSWLGAIGAGAGAGALVGTLGGGPIGTAVGGIVGGIGGAIGGEAFTEWLYDQKDAIASMGGKVKTAISEFGTKAGESISGLWKSIKTGASDARAWIGDKWSDFSSWFDTSVWTPAKDIGISAINIAAGAWETAKEAISEAWAPMAAWFDSNIWSPVKEGARAAGQWVSDRWNDAKRWVNERWSDFSGWFDETIWQPVKSGAQVAGAWVGERWSEAKTWVSETWGATAGWFDETVWQPVKSAAQTAGAWLGDQFTAAKNTISEAWSSVAGWFETNVWGPIKTGATAAWDWVGEKLGGIGEWIGDKWTSFKDWLGKMGAKGSKETGLTTSTGKGSVFEHAWGGIMTKPHMGIVAEDGAEGIIPLSPSKRARGLDLWWRTGELLGVRPYENGGIAGDIPTASAVPVRAGTGSVTQYIQARVEKVEVHPAFHIEGDNLDEENVVTIIKGRIREMADDIGDELAERLARIFANMPVKGGAGA